MGISPACVREVDEIHEGRVGIVVNSIAVDVAEQVTALRQDYGLVEVGALQCAPFHPEGFHSPERGGIELLKAVISEQQIKGSSKRNIFTSI